MKWFGHVQRRDNEYIDRRMLKSELPGRSGKRPKRRFLNVVREYR